MSNRNPLTTNADERVPLAHGPDQAAARLGIGKTMLYALIGAKEIRVIKLGSRTLVLESELQRFLASRLP